MENTANLNVAKRHATKEIAILEVYGRSYKINSRLANLSITGAFLELTSSNYQPKQGDLVRITVPLQKVNKTYTLHGQVVWSRGLGVGVSFLKDKDLHALLTKSTRI
ncbi:MAG: PilZ protein [Pseudobdellovibrio sp.]|jgi:hypothetical protein|nr:PilZ protein [Pseudobdellovibrio sp.]